MIIAPDGEVIQPLNGHNNNNGQTKSSQSQVGLGLDEAGLQCRICKR